MSGLLAGTAYCHAALPVPAELLLVAFVPLMWALFELVDNSVEGVRFFGPLYVCFFLYHGICNWWISSWQEQTDPYLFVSGLAVWLVHPLFLMAPWLGSIWLRKRVSASTVLVTIPFMMVAAEWVHGQTDLSYPWLTIGYAVIDKPMAQLAEFVGVYGLSFLIMVVNVLVYLALRRRVRGLNWIAPVVLALLICGGATLGGLYLLNVSNASPGDQTLTVSIVQPNTNPWDKWSAPSEQVRIHKDMTDSLRRSQSTSDLVVWSETAIPYVIRNYRYLVDWMLLRTWVDTSSVSLLTGYADLMVYPVGDAPPSARSLALDPSVKYDHFNAAMILNPTHRDVPVHRKTMLTPFAERLPFADQLSFAMKWVEWGVGISAWGKGRERVPLPVVRSGDTLARIGTIICIESIYPDVARDLTNHGADVLCIITNDAWYNGTWGPRQHYDIARMRAIEMRRPIIRCANSGVSGVIDASGSSQMELPELRRVAATSTVTVRRGRTLYAQFGDVIPIASLVISLLALLVARIPALLRILPTTMLRHFSHTTVTP